MVLKKETRGAAAEDWPKWAKVLEDIMGTRDNVRPPVLGSLGFGMPLITAQQSLSFFIVVLSHHCTSHDQRTAAWLSLRKQNVKLAPMTTMRKERRTRNLRGMRPVVVEVVVASALIPSKKSASGRAKQRMRMNLRNPTVEKEKTEKALKRPISQRRSATQRRSNIFCSRTTSPWLTLR